MQNPSKTRSKFSMENFTAPPSLVDYSFSIGEISWHTIHIPTANYLKRLTKGIPESQFAGLPDGILWQHPPPPNCAKEIMIFTCSEPKTASNIAIGGASGCIMSVTRIFLVICMHVASLPVTVAYATYIKQRTSTCQPNLKAVLRSAVTRNEVPR
jgi:hypothetical protein